MNPKKKLKNAYKNLNVPEVKNVLPNGAFETNEEKPAKHINRRRLYTVLTAAALVVALMMGVFGVMMLQSANEEIGVPADLSQDISKTPIEQSQDVSNTPVDQSQDASETPAVPSDDTSETPAVPSDDTSTTPADPLNPGETSYNDGVIRGITYTPVDGVVGPADEKSEGYADYGGYEVVCEDIAFDAAPDEEPSESKNIKAGTLTASEWKDTKNLAEWLDNVGAHGWTGYISRRGLYSDNVIEVKVTSSGAAIFNRAVELYGADGKLLWTARTDISGYAYLFYKDSDKGTLKVKTGGSEKTVSAGNGQQKFDTVAFDIGAEAEKVKQLDLMLMVDTTGSMGDELEYLKVELADMVERVAKADEALSIRVSVNFYRDVGDEYIVKYYDFRSDISECVAQINAERSFGGGDWPEAVHTALDNAINGHQWRSGAVKICFLVLDAPPHDETEIQGINADIEKSLISAAANGIRIIPVASSGVDIETEVLLRSFALMTGGSYIYLTNDSGVGGYHEEATVSEKNVEPLNECMIRVVCEACGIPYTPATTYNGQGGQTEQSVYAVNYDESVEAASVLTYRPASAAAGDKVEIRGEVLHDADYRLFVDGTEIEKTHYDSDYWGYSFIMPAHPVTISIEFLTKAEIYG